MAAVAVGSVGLCAVAAMAGQRFRGRYNYYFYPIVDAGHPGAIQAVGASGFAVAATLGLVVGLLSDDDRHVRASWIAASALTAWVSLDDLLRIHNHIGAGDVIARAVYWPVLVIVVVRLRPTLRRRRGARALVAALGLFAVSELIGLRTSLGIAHHDLLDSLEEASSFIGAWILAAGMLGVMTTTLKSIRRSRVQPGGEPTGAAGDEWDVR